MKLRNIEQELTATELYVATQVGMMRRLASRQNGNNKNLHAYKSDWATDVAGACAELAVAKFYGVHWNMSVNSFKLPDLSNGWEVRSADKENHCLIVRDNDDGERIYIFVLSIVPNTFRLVGSKKGADCKTKEFFRPENDAGGDAWFVPQDQLDDLPSKDFA